MKIVCKFCSDRNCRSYSSPWWELTVFRFHAIIIKTGKMWICASRYFWRLFAHFSSCFEIIGKLINYPFMPHGYWVIHAELLNFSCHFHWNALYGINNGIIIIFNSHSSWFTRLTHISCNSWCKKIILFCIIKKLYLK